MNLFYKEFKQIISNKLFMVTWLVIVVALSFFMSIDVKSSSAVEAAGAKLGISNEDTSGYSKMFIDFITQSEQFSKIVSVTVSDKDELESMFYSGKLDAYITIPDGFIRNIMNIKETPVNVKVSDADTVTALLVSNILDSYQEYVSAIQLNITGLNDCYRDLGFSEAANDMACFKVTYNLVQSVFEKTEYMDTVEIDDYNTSSVIIYFIYAAIALVIMYGSLFAGVDILKEKEYWVLNRYLITGNSKVKFILTKIFFYTIALYLIIFIPTSISVLTGHGSFNYLMLLLYFIFILLSVSFSVFLCFVTYDLNVYALAGNMLYIVSAIIGGGIIPIMYMPDSMTGLAKFTPTRLFVRNFIDVYNGKQFSDICGQILMCIAATVILTAASIVLFGKNAARQE